MRLLKELGVISLIIGISILIFYGLWHFIETSLRASNLPSTLRYGIFFILLGTIFILIFNLINVKKKKR